MYINVKLKNIYNSLNKNSKLIYEISKIVRMNFQKKEAEIKLNVIANQYWIS